VLDTAAGLRARRQGADQVRKLSDRLVADGERRAFALAGAEIHYVAATMSEDARKVVGGVFVWTDDLVLHGETGLDNDGMRLSEVSVYARRDLEHIELLDAVEDDWPKKWDPTWPPSGRLELH
jgi:hypothetical protein